MVVYNYSGKEINAKIVYYGPALSGKTTNLEWIYSKIPVEYSGKMVSLRTQADRTIFFDFLPLDLGMIDGFRTRFMLYTVPGQVHYNATRKMVLKGVDGLVFVADSEPGRMDDNIESLQNLRDNLQELGMDPDSLPLVMQWNKRDLPHSMPVADLETRLNPRGLPSFEACALTGEGVYETLHKVCRQIYTKLTGLQMGGTESEDGASLFGAPIAACLQDVDYPQPEPERVALDQAALQASTSHATQSAADVMGAILGGSAERESAPADVGSPESIPQPVAVGGDDPGDASRPQAAPSSGTYVGGGDATQPISPVRSPNLDSPATPQGGGGLPVEPTDEDAMVDGLVDEVLFGIDETGSPSGPASAPILDSEIDGIPAMDLPSGPVQQPDAPASAGGEMERPLIEHDTDVFDELDSVREKPDPGPGSESQAGMGGFDLDAVLNEHADSDDEVEFITDPLKLPGERRSESSSVASSGSFGGPVTNAKILEVPVTLDASALEEGKTIRIVLNLTVRR